MLKSDSMSTKPYSHVYGCCCVYTEHWTYQMEKNPWNSVMLSYDFCTCVLHIISTKTTTRPSHKVFNFFLLFLMWHSYATTTTTTTKTTLPMNSIRYTSVLFCTYDTFISIFESKNNQFNLCRLLPFSSGDRNNDGISPIKIDDAKHRLRNRDEKLRFIGAIVHCHFVYEYFITTMTHIYQFEEINSISQAPIQRQIYNNTKVDEEAKSVCT